MSKFSTGATRRNEALRCSVHCAAAELLVQVDDGGVEGEEPTDDVAGALLG